MISFGLNEYQTYYILTRSVKNKCCLCWFCRCPLSYDWSNTGQKRFLCGVLHLDVNLDMVTGLWLTYIPNFGSLSWCWRCKEHLCPLSPDLGFWLVMEVSDWGLAFWSWFGYGHESLIWLWLLAWALAFGFGIDFCTVELRKYVDLGGFGFRWVQLKLKISQS